MTNRRKELVLIDNAECVRGDILVVLGALRRLGRKTVDGLSEIARHAGVLPRRTKTIVMRDQTCIVTDEQRRHFSLALADKLERIAEEHEQIAEELRRDGDAIRYRERQQLALAFGGNPWGGRGNIYAPNITTASRLRAA